MQTIRDRLALSLTRVILLTLYQTPAPSKVFLFDDNHVHVYGGAHGIFQHKESHCGGGSISSEHNDVIHDQADFFFGQKIII